MQAVAHAQCEGAVYMRIRPGYVMMIVIRNGHVQVLCVPAVFGGRGCGGVHDREILLRLAIA